MKNNQLKKDLKASGASAKEQDELLAIAEQLEVFKNLHLSNKTREKIAQIPYQNQKGATKRPSLRFTFSSLAMATAVFAFVLLGYSQISKQSPNSTTPVEQVRETELEEIETKLQESESQLKELQQVEEAPPEVIEEAEEEYEQALDRWKHWKSENNSDSSEDSDDRHNYRRRSNDGVRGRWTDRENDDEEQEDEQQYLNRFWRR